MVSVLLLLGNDYEVSRRDFDLRKEAQIERKRILKMLFDRQGWRARSTSASI
jgi:hypothetical protein